MTRAGLSSPCPPLPLIRSEIEVPQTGAQGLIATHGGRFAGWGLYLLAGKPVFHYNLAGVERYSAAAKEKLAPGKHTLKMSFQYEGGGPGRGGTATLPSPARSQR